MNIESSNDPQSFVNFELDGWETVSQGYEDHFAKLTSQSVDAILDAGDVSSGKEVLDVCCGPGMIATAAAARGARATGIDFSAAVIKVANSSESGAKFQQGDAQSLSFTDNSYDSVVCGFGIIHLPDPQKALSEMYRVLKPGGRVALSVWEPPNAGNGFGLLFGSIKAHADMGVDLPHGPDFFQFSDPARLTDALQETGFKEPSINTVEQTWEFNDASGMFTGIMEGAVRARALIAAQTTTVQEAVSNSVSVGMDAYNSSDGIYRVPMPALIGSAIK